METGNGARQGQDKNDGYPPGVEIDIRLRPKRFKAGAEMGGPVMLTVSIAGVPIDPSYAVKLRLNE